MMGFISSTSNAPDDCPSCRLRDSDALKDPTGVVLEVFAASIRIPYVPGTTKPGI